MHNGSLLLIGAVIFLALRGNDSRGQNDLWIAPDGSLVAGGLWQGGVPPVIGAVPATDAAMRAAGLM